MTSTPTPPKPTAPTPPTAPKHRQLPLLVLISAIVTTCLALACGAFAAVAWVGPTADSRDS
ncbi:MAG: hypothetical protein LBG60_17800, partial [Bifidobacteriaceae bacterium]|nr:hypothetical protein [Bifidobacteriaceae bacterium]